MLFCICIVCFCFLISSNTADYAKKADSSQERGTFCCRPDSMIAQACDAIAEQTGMTEHMTESCFNSCTGYSE